ncbi:calcium uptake protein 1 homolog, mitochondrial [Drosophila montana]|uniref:calcium uptake protein 1 homolog, mitochondrial n=1 Tax=Drosophila montana TaxID=40370 RepID=UPI00313C4520
MQGWLLHTNAEKLNPEAKKSSGFFPKEATGHRVTFRDITIQEYENRLRAYSQPQKIFCYFATIKTENDAGKLKVFMTPVDFLRSLRPGLRQPEGLGLNEFRNMTREKVKKLKFKGLAKDSIFYKLRPDGLITFCDFLYLVMLLTMPEKYFKMGFRLFEQQENGNLGIRDMNTLVLGITHDDLFKNISAVHFYFFGPHLTQKLSLDKFLEFRRQLQHDVLLLEFNLLLKKRKPTDANKPPNKTISEVCFAKLLLKCSSMSKAEKTETLIRINKKYQPLKRGITQDEFMSFFEFVQHLPDIETALSYHYLAGADISRGALKHISDVLVGVPLSPHLIDVIFTVFNAPNSGILGRNGFIEALRHRMLRCKHTSLKLADLYGSVLKCVKETWIV